MSPLSDQQATDTVRKPWDPPRCQEIFVQRYTWLRDWALRLSRGDQVEADDLLHNAFLQFVLRKRELAEIGDLEAYLYGLLRRLRLSSARKALRRRQEPLLAIDYEAAAICLADADAHALLQVNEELAAVCEYACRRKDSSKAGSVLILRFFHGYYPKEIAKILRSPLRLANDWLRIARHEARVYLEDPSRLAFMTTGSAREPSGNGSRRHDRSTSPRHGVATAADILQPLRSRIRQARTGSCLTPLEVRRLYGDAGGNTVCSATLSHIVSCPACLDLVTSHLNLTPYSDRDPRDMLGPDGGWRAETRTARGDSISAMLRACTERLRAVLAHRPTELLIAGNGLPLGMLRVRSVDTEVELAVNLDEQLDFIEVFSEQGVRLLLFEVDAAPHGAVEQTARIEFDEGRWLESKVEFTNAWPTVHLAYHDPAFASTGEPSDSPLNAAITAVAHDDSRAHRAGAEPLPAIGWRERLSRLRGAPFLRPAFGIATVVAAVALWATLPWHGRAASASELIRSVGRAEQTLISAPNVVVHRVLLVEERRPPEPVLNRQRLEVWHDGAHGIAVRRLYDERNRLAAGEWTSADGARTIYRPGAGPKRLARQQSTFDRETIWGFEPSASLFSELVGAPASTTVEDRRTDYVLHYRNQSDSAADIVEATLTINKADMRAVAQRLLVRVDGDVREFSFTETALASLPASTVPPTTFEPEPELIGRALPVETTARLPSAAPARSASTPVLDVEAANRLELDALFALHRLETCLANPAELRRRADGGVHVRAAARGAACRDRVLGTLAAFGRAPVLDVDVPLATTAAMSPPIDGSALQLPAYRALVERLNPSGASTDAAAAESARTFGAWAIERAASAKAEADELEQLAGAWTPERLRALDIDRTTMWLDVVRDHARRLRRDSEQLRQQLEGVFAIDPARTPLTAEPPSIEIRSASDVAGAVARLVSLAASHHTAMRQLFDTALDAPRVPVDIAALARSLRAGEAQAAWFDEPWTIESSPEVRSRDQSLPQ